MKERYTIRNDRQFVQFPKTEGGYQEARKFRRNNPEFKYRRIREVLQAFPSTVPCGVVHNLT